MSSVKSISRAGQYKWWFANNSTFKISSSFACRNQGNYIKGRKYSFSFTSIQNPCNDIFVTSNSEVFLPCVSDFIFMTFNNFCQFSNFLLTDPIIMGQFNLGFYPKFSFSIGPEYMYVYAPLFPREEKKPVVFISKNCRTHSVTNIQQTFK